MNKQVNQQNPRKDNNTLCHRQAFLPHAEWARFCPINKSSQEPCRTADKERITWDMGYGITKMLSKSSCSFQKLQITTLTKWNSLMEN